MMKRIMFPKTVMNRIVLFSGDYTLLEIFKDGIDYSLLKSGISFCCDKILLYGQVQSGKTEAIFQTIRNPEFANINKVLVLQNSLSMLKQYQQRLTANGIPFHVIGPLSKHLSNKMETIPCDTVLLLMNNKYRYAHYLSMTCKPTKYIALMDESDQYRSGSHPVADKALAQYYITATPFHKNYRREQFFNKVSKINTTENYVGLKDVVLSFKGLPEAVDEFMGVANGMMLINSVCRVKKMNILAQELSTLYPDTPIMVLNKKKWVYQQGGRTSIINFNISSIIDKYKDETHIIFIANRLSLRGISYVSSDYNRNLTHQFSNFNKLPLTICIQKMRLLGKNSNSGPRTLYLGEETPKLRKRMNRILLRIEKGIEKLPLKKEREVFKICPDLSKIMI